MTESVFTLEDVSVPEFLGLDNQFIKEIALAFPKSKVVSRGNEIRLLGEPEELERIQNILNSLLEHFHQNGKISKEIVKKFTEEDKQFHAPLGANNSGKIGDVLLIGSKGNVIKIKTHNQKAMVDSIEKNDLVFAIGPAGTGKTYTAVALAVKALKERQVKKIIFTRPAVEAGENLGFLPGDLKEKLDPYLRPIHDALEDMIPAEKLKMYRETNTIEIAPLAYMRGRTLNNAFIILDEAQNATPLQIKMFLTRMGPQSKVIITGDKSQVDLPKKQK
ncbi:MAG: PhoH family protein, partial [Cytophagales bacterium]